MDNLKAHLIASDVDAVGADPEVQAVQPEGAADPAAADRAAGREGGERRPRHGPAAADAHAGSSSQQVSARS